MEDWMRNPAGVQAERLSKAMVALRLICYVLKGWSGK